MSQRYEPRGRQQLERDAEEAVLRQLIAARQAGDIEEMRHATAIFVQGRYDQLLAIARLNLPNGHDAEDVVGETILSALDSLGPDRKGFEGTEPGELGGWLIRILRRRIADHFRRESRRVKTMSLSADSRDDGDGPGPIPEPHALTGDPVAEVQFRDAHSRVRAGLSPPHRKVVDLWWRERLPASEIIARLQSADTGVDAAFTVDNVHQIISRYRAKMRKELEVGD